MGGDLAIAWRPADDCPCEFALVVVGTRQEIRRRTSPECPFHAPSEPPC